MFDHIVKSKLGEIKSPPVDDAWKKYQESLAHTSLDKPVFGFKFFLLASLLAALVSSVALFVGVGDSPSEPKQNESLLSTNAMADSGFTKQQVAENQLSSPQFLQEEPYQIRSYVKPEAQTKPIGHTPENKTISQNPVVKNPGFKRVGLLETSGFIKNIKSPDFEYVLGHELFAQTTFTSRYSLNLTGSYGLIPVQSLSNPQTYGFELAIESHFLRGSSLSLGVGIQNTDILDISVSRSHQGIKDSLTHSALNHVLVPVTISYPLHKDIKVYFGPQVGFLRNTSGTYHIKNSSTIPVENQKEQRLNEFYGLRTVDFGVRAGLEYNYRRVRLGLRYQQSFSDFTRNDVLNEDFTHRVGTLQVTLGLSLTGR